MIMIEQLARAYHIATKDMRTYYLKPPLISWGVLFPLVMLLSFYLRDPSDIRSVSPGLIGLTMLFGATSMEEKPVSIEYRRFHARNLRQCYLPPSERYTVNLRHSLSETSLDNHSTRGILKSLHPFKLVFQVSRVHARDKVIGTLALDEHVALLACQVDVTDRQFYLRNFTFQRCFE